MPSRKYLPNRRMAQGAVTSISIGFLLVLALPTGATPNEEGAKTWFENEVRPVLAKHCFTCHGPEKQKSALRLDSGHGIFTGGSRGPAVEGGNDDSLLLQAVRQTGELKMPPDGPLSATDIETLTRWIQEGAIWPDYDPSVKPERADFREMRNQHWAYQPLAEFVPKDGQKPPEVIDTFIEQSLNQTGLHPSPTADRRSLIRRVTYDLTGLPPTPEEADAFVTDPNPDAFATLVDRLLASPRYGERWARHWLDVVRYTDSFDSRGTPKTDPVEIWRYRDWVVEALNNDMPYDEFAALQIAGDLMPLPDGAFNRDGLIATGMLAIGHWPQGDADKEKMVTDIVDDQVDVVTRTFLGATMACARCHDHKFDPFTTEDYYGIAGMFFSSTILPGPGAKTEGSPMGHWPLATPEVVARRAETDARLKALTEEKTSLLAQSRAVFSNQQLAQTGAYLLATRQETPTEGSGLNGEVLQNWKRLLTGDIRPALPQVQESFQGQPGLTTRNGTEGTPSAVGNATDAEVAYTTITQAPNSVAIHPGPAEGVGIGWRSPRATTVTISGRLADADGNCGDGVQWIVSHYEGGLGRTLVNGQFANGGTSTFEIDTPIAVAAGDQIRLTVLPNAGHACDTTEVVLQVTSDTGQLWSITQDVLPGFATGNPWPDATGNPDVWWLFTENGGTDLDPVLFAPWRAALREVQEGRRDESVLVEAAAAIQGAIDGAMANAESPLKNAVAHLSEAGSPAWVDGPPSIDPDRFAAIEQEMASLAAEVREPFDLAVGIQEGGVPATEYEGFHDVRVHRRGEHTNLGDVVPRRAPAIMAASEQHPVTEGSGRDRLAQWLSGDCAPLLARVMVNRVWQHHFGEGLVRTPGDFGSQGQPPTHPELLDFLAAQFIDTGWSLKSLHRAILNSATYQQQSGADETLHNADPENRWLARMNRRRLDAESLRDSLLSVTDQLDPTPGGPAFVELDTPRRTLYLRTVRSNLSTFTQLFDGADPTSIVPARNESTVSPQALFLMNHPLILSTSDTLAKLASSDTNTSAVETMYRRLFLRAPTEAERHIAETALQQLGYPENETALAAYAQVLLSSNEFYFID